MSAALLGFAALMALAFLRVPIAFAMAAVGVVGVAALRDWHWGPAFAMAAKNAYESGFNYNFSVVPLFILMGNFVTRAGMSRELFRAANAFVGHLRGGLAMATVIACAGFGAICGSSIATAATMARVAYPEMKSRRYADTLSTGAIAAGGTLGILIPPSTIMVIYGIMTDTHIGKLFAAGVLPGLLATLLLCMAVVWVTARDPLAGPGGPRSSWRERAGALAGIWPVVLLFAVVMGGIYGGWFTATEGAGFGASGAFLFALARRSLSFRVLYEVLIESARTTAMLFTILIGAFMFADFINFTSMPGDLKAFVQQLGVHPVLVVAAIMAIYVVLGTAMEELSMILLTVPVFFPLVVSLGIDPVWFGILIVVVVEIGLISPPVGMNLFVLRTLLPQVPTTTVFRGVMPFLAADVLRLAILVAFPAISLWLPGVLKL
jgi:C4-dicarboxylate transporter, DctM subunit